MRGFPQLDRLARRGSCSIAGVGRSTRLDQQQMRLFLGKRLVLDATRHDEEFARPEHNFPFAQPDDQPTLQHQKEVIGVGVGVPDDSPRTLTTMMS